MEIQSGIVSTEGDELYCKVRGTGKPILFIAPGGGNGDDYLPVANILADTYKVITYDRRANLSGFLPQIKSSKIIYDCRIKRN